MMSRRLLVFGSVLAALLAVPVAAQNNQGGRRLTDAQRREVQAIDRLMAAATASRPAPNDFSMTWVREDPLMKVPENLQYVPFSVAIDPSSTTAKELFVYWRVVAKTPAENPAPDNRRNDRDKPPAFAYEDMNNATVQPGQRQVVSRSFTVAPGEYDVQVVIKEPASTQRNAPPAKASFLTHSVTVPDFWQGELTTSSVIVAERIEPLAAPLTPQQQGERPYALGALEIVPAPDDRYGKGEELQMFLLIYNAQTDAQNKPDVTVEFNFYAKEGNEEKFFNKTNPQELNANTLPPQWDPAAGHQLQSGQSVPLGSFPEGDYRLEIKITDKLANTSTTRDVNFTVTGS